MFARVGQRLVAILAAFGVLGLALLPPEHVHVTETRDGHHSDLVHRHYAPHQPIGSGINASDEEHDVQWLDSTFTRPQPTLQHVSIHELLTETPTFHGPQLTREGAVRIDDLSVHDPPPLTPSGLRAPPSLVL